MKKILFILLMGLLLCWLGHPFPAMSQERKTYNVLPVTNQGHKWRLGYLEGGHYSDYVGVMKMIITHLVRLGWINSGEVACLQKVNRTRDIWNCLTNEVKSNYLEFVSDAYWSADWDPKQRQINKEDFLSRANQTKDLDLILTFGTWAGQDLANDRHHVPTVVCSTSNAVAAGIISSPQDSGRDHVHARIDPTRYARQVRFFHEVVKFKRMGVVLENTNEGGCYAGMDQIEPLARERGFEIVKCYAQLSGVDLETSEKTLVACHEKLAPLVDALYITKNRGVNEKNMSKLLAPLFKHQVPNFAMGTLYEVRYGAMMSMAQPDFNYAGEFYSQVMAQIFNGAKPRELNQIMEDPHSLSINLKAAAMIGFDFPMDILGGADEIIKDILK